MCIVGMNSMMICYVNGEFKYCDKMREYWPIFRLKSGFLVLLSLLPGAGVCCFESVGFRCFSMATRKDTDDLDYLRYVTWMQWEVGSKVQSAPLLRSVDLQHRKLASRGRNIEVMIMNRNGALYLLSLALLALFLLSLVLVFVFGLMIER